MYRTKRIVEANISPNKIVLLRETQITWASPNDRMRGNKTNEKEVIPFDIVEKDEEEKKTTTTQHIVLNQISSK